MSLFGATPSLFSSAPSTSWRQHWCGLYYTIPSNGQLEKLYLPQVDLQAHTTILSTTSRTVLTQTFVNPSDTKGIKKVRYIFPLYDGVSVVGFTCHIGDRTIVGEVKEKEKARAVFQEAVARGETAGLFEQLPDASDVFTTTVGNIPPGAKVIIKITYLGELKHDMEVDGIRFTIPNIICPRYGKYPLGLTSNSIPNAHGSGISITVDAEMADGSFIQKMQSPSHPIAISMGITSFAPNAEPTMAKSSATLSLGTAQLDTDFVLQIVAKDSGIPKAIVETHPTIPNQRALMATLVPKFALPPEKPEIVFLVDRSGSMAGSRIKLVVQALRVFLKSLPVSVKFNICSFGSSYMFLWPNGSKTYNQQTLDEAVRHVETLDANLGGTEMFQPVKATIDARYKDIPLEVMLLTDGEIWDQKALFDYLNKEVQESQAPIRVFTLGIGNGVSHSLIEGIARAGNGFSQAVGEGEKMDSKVVRMLKGALSPHINDYSLEVKYAENNDTMSDEDDFEIVEKVADSLKVRLPLESEKASQPKKTISLFDSSADPDKVAPSAYDETGEARYSHLPKITEPKIIQVPQRIPSLFAFNRTTVYLLLGPDAPQKTPKSVTLRGTSTHGPLELEIPVQVLGTPGQTIHQLAAKKATTELEQGRGWLSAAKDESDQLVKEKFPSRFEDMMEREAVRLGVQYQVGGKWCSFVAVEKKKTDQEETEDYEWLDVNVDTQSGYQSNSTSRSSKHVDFFGSWTQPAGFVSTPPPPPSGGLFGAVRSSRALLPLSAGPGARGGLFGGGSPTSFSSASLPASSRDFSRDTSSASFSFSPSAGGSLFGTTTSTNAAADSTNDLMEFNFDTFAERGKGLDTLTNRYGALSTSTTGLHFSGKESSSPSGGLFGGSSASSASTSTGGGLFGVSSATQAQRQSSYVPTAFGTPAPKPTLPPITQAAALAPPPVRISQETLAQYQKEMESAACMPLPDEEMDDDLVDNTPLSMRTTGTRGLFGQTSTSSGPDSGKFVAGGAFGRAFATAKSPIASPFSNAFGNVSDPHTSARLGSTGAGFGSASNTNLTTSTSAFGSADGFGSAFGAAPSTSLQNPFAPAPTPAKKPKTDDEKLDTLIALQTFEGYWEWTAELFETIGVAEADAARATSSGKVSCPLATALAIAFFEEKLGGKKGSWELVVEKAKGWLGEKVGLVQVAKKLLMGEDPYRI
ncbi:von Willebrand factor type A domain-containing protein [Lophiotrema nucula]|uniref:von Willebrand factor type A domain-containing protein n=1 Tax=Lophiotrema nucula TaxID=690887 RepID=A0A6A5YUG6_9PLEO|nr:von Willebrand factor type A domain-containing protein [Lophiotrema nucula]